MNRHMILLVVFAFLLGACSSSPAVPVEESAPVVPEAAPEVAEEAAPAVEEAAEAVAETAPELIADDCLNGEASPIAESIAADYDQVGYDQIVIWFCNGAEYEDILVALETEALTDATVEEMLQMLADGFTWDNIWQELDLTE